MARREERPGDERKTEPRGGASPRPASSGPAPSHPPREKPLPDAAELARTCTPLVPPAGFVEAAAELGIAFDAGDVEKLGRYLAVLLEVNVAMNLTAVRDPEEAWRRHILDSLTLLGALADLPEGARVIDVGSGGGLPGIPLAITMPHLKFTLLEATAKKAAFLGQVASGLGLTNVHVVPRRAEEAAHDRGERIGHQPRAGGHREAYDAVVARAVGPMDVLAELTVPFAKVGGRILLIKGAKADEELAAAQRALHLLKAVHVSTIETPTGRIVALEKGSSTPRTYPRASGEPKRAPLR